MARGLTAGRGGAFGVAALALAARLAVIAWAATRFPAAEDGHYYDVLARRLAAGQGYTWAWDDGAVTYAAHYPVGYPALLALAYGLLGGAPAVGMAVSAVLGAFAAYAAHCLVDGEGVAAWRPLAAGVAVALHPALVPYSAAFMTEGVSASLLVAAAAVGAWARRAPPGGARAWAPILAAGVVMGLATLVRPQLLLLAPVLGALAAAAGAGARARLARSALVTAVALACVAPWTARNCARMHRCALVSVNGGWNLLIGAQTTTGAWEPVDVPAACATAWDEAGKDACFGGVARGLIADHPLAWLARAPGKIAATFDYVGAAPWYLHSSNPGSFGDVAKLRLGAFETVTCRLLLVAALVALGRAAGPRPLARRAVALLGAVAALTLHGWIGYLGLVAAVALLGPRAWTRAPLVVPWTAAVIALTALVHAAFFGAGRYGLVVVALVATLPFTDRRVSEP